MEERKLIRTLVKNYGFKPVKFKGLPSVDYVYPDYMVDGNNEEFRYSSSLRNELRARANIVKDDFKDKHIIYSGSDEIIKEIGLIAPRLGIEGLVFRKIHSIYHPMALLFTGVKDEDISSYVVKFVMDNNAAWFELANEENKNVADLLKNKANENPYKPNLVERLLNL